MLIFVARAGGRDNLSFMDNTANLIRTYNTIAATILAGERAGASDRKMAPLYRALFATEDMIKASRGVW